MEFLTSEPHDDRDTMTLGPWRLVRELGGGGMGTVWLAERADGAFRMNAAVKLIKPDAAAPITTRRFRRERQILADLTHANICRLLDGGTGPDGRPYLVMEYVDGHHLDLFCRDRALSTRDILHLILPICSALSAAHGRGIVHRDLKPSNIIVTSAGEPKLVDFGIASACDSADLAVTQTGQMVLTPSYASPEQWYGEHIGPASDIFSLGIILFELLAGWLPHRPGFLGVTPTPAVKAALGDDLYQLLVRAVQEKPEDRYPGAEALARALCDHLGVAAAGVALGERTRSPRPAPDMPPKGMFRDATTVPPGIRARSKVLPDDLAGGNHAETATELPGDLVSQHSPYFVRPAVEDRCVREVLAPGALIRIKGPRQMGKTSLMTRLLCHAREAGARTVAVDLRMADQSILGDLDRFLRWLCAVSSRQLGVRARPGGDQWDDIFGAKDNCTAYFEDHLLSADSLVLAIDHMDRVFESAAIADEFLSLLRAWHEMGKSQDPWPALRLILVHATEIYLPMDINHSPFNVGLSVALSEWDAGAVEDLAGRHGLSMSQSDIERLMSLLGGHPHLIRLALYHMAEHGMSLDDMLANAATDQGLFADHLKYLLWQIETRPELGEAAARVMAAGDPVTLDTEPAFKLASLGLLRLQGNNVCPARELYRRYFAERLRAQP